MKIKHILNLSCSFSKLIINVGLVDIPEGIAKRVNVKQLQYTSIKIYVKVKGIILCLKKNLFLVDFSTRSYTIVLRGSIFLFLVSCC